MNKKWAINKASENTKEEYLKLQEKLVDLMVDFGVLSIKTFEIAKGEPLNILQIDQTVYHEIELVKANLSRTDCAELIAMKVEKIINNKL